MLKRNLVTSLLLYESVRTTKKRAKVIQPVIDKLVLVAKTKPAHTAIRMINKTVTDKNASKKIMEVFKDRYADRSSGLTRMVPVGARKGDGAELVDLSLVEGSDVGQRTSDVGKEAESTKSSPKSEVRSSSKKKSKTNKKP